MLEGTRELRLRRLRSILTLRYKGVVADLARAIGKDPNQTRFILNPNKPGGRSIGEKLARQIEQSLKLPPSWLDGGDEEPPPLHTIDSRVNALPIALREDLLERLVVHEQLARELPFAFTGPIAAAQMQRFEDYILKRAAQIRSERKN